MKCCTAAALGTRKNHLTPSTKEGAWSQQDAYSQQEARVELLGGPVPSGPHIASTPLETGSETDKPKGAPKRRTSGVMTLLPGRDYFQPPTPPFPVPRLQTIEGLALATPLAIGHAPGEFIRGKKSPLSLSAAPGFERARCLS